MLGGLGLGRWQGNSGPGKDFSKKLKRTLKIVKVDKVINAVKVANVVGESLTALTPLI